MDVLCLDCETISNETRHKCPKCAGGSLVSLSTFMDRESEPAPCALGAHVTAGGDASANVDSGSAKSETHPVSQRSKPSWTQHRRVSCTRRRKPAGSQSSACFRPNQIAAIYDPLKNKSLGKVNYPISLP
jgi:hypothetical protein